MIKRIFVAALGVVLMSSCSEALDHSPVAESFRNACVKENSNRLEYCECMLLTAKKSFSNERFKEMWLLMESRNPYNGREDRANKMGNALSDIDFKIYISSAGDAVKEAKQKCEPIKYQK